MTKHPLPTTPASTQIDRWRCLVAVQLSIPLDPERLALTPISQAFAALAVPAADQERLVTSLVGALAQISERDQGGQSTFLVAVRLLVLPLLADAYANAQGAAPSTIPTPTTPTGWGFFLVEHSGTESRNTSSATPSMIELFLYREGER